MWGLPKFVWFNLMRSWISVSKFRMQFQLKRTNRCHPHSYRKNNQKPLKSVSFILWQQWGSVQNFFRNLFNSGIFIDLVTIWVGVNKIFCVLTGRVDCSSEKMNIVISRKYLNSLGLDGYNLYLNDPYCRPRISTQQVVFSFPIDNCGNIKKVENLSTSWKHYQYSPIRHLQRMRGLHFSLFFIIFYLYQFENGKVVFTNTLRAYTSSSGEITRTAHLKLNVGCQMEQDSVSQIMYIVQHPGNSSIRGTGRFNTSMSFYTSSSFYYKVCWGGKGMSVGKENFCFVSTFTPCWYCFYILRWLKFHT